MNETQQRVKTEVVEETSEALEVLRQERIPRPEKMQRENALLRGAHEVHFSERRVHVRDDIELIRNAVDHLNVERRALPEARPPPPPPPAPEPEPEAPQAQLTASERTALEKLVPGSILRIDTLYRTSAGHAVEVVFETPEGARRTDSFVLREGKAATVDDLGRVLDEIPLPVKTVSEEPVGASTPASADAPAEAPAAPPAAPAETPAPLADEPGKKRRFGFGKKKEDAAPAPEAAPAAEPAAPEEPKKKRFGFGGKKAAEPPAPEAAAPETPAETKKKRFGFGKKGAGDAPATDATAAAEPAADAAPEEGAGKKRRFGLGRGKK